MIVEKHLDPIFGSHVRYLTSGSGQPIVLVSGLFGTADNFIPFMQLFPKHYECIAVDLPGFGKSTRMLNRPHTVENYVAFLDKFLQALKIDQPILVGISLGGSILLDFASTYPLRAKKLVIQSPVYRPLKVMLNGRFYLWLLYHTSWFGSLVLFLARYRLIQAVIFYLFADKSIRCIGYHNFCEYGMKNLLTHLTAQTVKECAQSVLNIHLEDRIKTITDDVLLIYGTTERTLFPREYQEELSGLLPNCKFEVVTGMDHAFILQMPERFVQVVLDDIELLAD